MEMNQLDKATALVTVCNTFEELCNRMTSSKWTPSLQACSGDTKAQKKAKWDVASELKARGFMVNF